jgi:hypothetical protein
MPRPPAPYRSDAKDQERTSRRHAYSITSSASASGFAGMLRVAFALGRLAAEARAFGGRNAAAT